MSASPRILVIRRDNIGDLACTTPLFDALRAQLPGAHVAALVTTYNAEVLARNPSVDELFVYEELKHRSGLGTRLRPLTDLIPKPLVPVANRPLLEYTFALLAAAGVREAIVNAHHLADELERGLRGLDPSGLALHVSRERRILGTAGGLKRAESFLAGGTFLLLNGDFLVELDLRKVLEFHAQQHATATMVLMPDANAGVLGVDPDGVIRRFIAPRPADEPAGRLSCGFTGIHVLEPKVFQLIPANSTPWEINRQVYPELLARGRRVCGYVHRGYRREAGSPEGYAQAFKSFMLNTA